MGKPLCELLCNSLLWSLAPRQRSRESKEEGSAKKTLTIKFIFLPVRMMCPISFLILAHVWSPFPWVLLTKDYLFYGYVQIIFFFPSYLQYTVFVLINLFYSHLFLSFQCFFSSASFREYLVNLFLFFLLKIRKHLRLYIFLRLALDPCNWFWNIMFFNF